MRKLVTPILLTLCVFANCQNNILFKYNLFKINETIIMDEFHPFKTPRIGDIIICMHERFSRKIVDKHFKNIEYFWQKAGIEFTEGPNSEITMAMIHLNNCVTPDDNVKMTGYYGIIRIGDLYLDKNITIEELKDVLQNNDTLRGYWNKYYERNKNSTEPEVFKNLIGFDFDYGGHQAELEFDEKTHKLETIYLMF